MSSSYQKAAGLLGWKWSDAHGGLISESHRKGPDWADYFVAEDAEDACFQDGIENDAQAAAYVIERAESSAQGL
jgi:hypothetical protein